VETHWPVACEKLRKKERRSGKSSDPLASIKLGRSQHTANRVYLLQPDARAQIYIILMAGRSLRTITLKRASYKMYPHLLPQNMFAFRNVAAAEIVCVYWGNS